MMAMWMNAPRCAKKNPTAQMISKMTKMVHSIPANVFLPLSGGGELSRPRASLLSCATWRAAQWGSMDLNGAAVVVTGGRGGLGSVICQAFVDAGSRVLAVDVIPPDSGRIIAGVAQHQADTATPEGTQSLVGAALAELGRIDVLVNNAGINKWVEFTDLDGMT